MASTASSWSQDLKLTEAIISVSEQLAEDESDPEAAAMYIEKLHELAENPVRVNSSDETEISRLFFLSDFQIKALADYSHSTGKIFSVFEIANIPGFNRETTEMMIPFITLDSNPATKADSIHFRSTILTNFSIRGEKDSATEGSQWKILTKYKFTSGSVSGGFTAEKDAGEKMFNERVPDFFSSYFAFSGKGFIRKFVLGDYSAKFGQGLNVNTGLRTGVALTAQGSMASRNEIRQYSSTDENKFFRGVATGFTAGKMDIDLFYSFNNIDATAGMDSVESLYTAGLHTTDLLMKKKDVLSLQTYGANIVFNLGNTRLGTAWTRDRLSLPLIKNTAELRNINDFSGNRNQLYSLYYSTIIKKMLFYGEIAINDSLQKALIQGVSLRMSDRLTVNLLYRNYEAGFFSFHGKGPGSSISWNERGLMGNFSFEAAKHLFLSAGVDMRQFPWLRYRCSAPSSAMKKEIRLKYLPSDNLSFEVLYNYSMSMTDDPQSERISLQKENVTRSLRWSVRFSPHENFTLATRMDFKSYNNNASKGMLMFQDASYSFSQIPLSLWFRYCLFKTDSWDSRLYAYENDILYSFSIPSLSGEGSRSYMMIRYKISRMTEVRFRYGISFDGDKDQGDFKFQLKLNF